ncbi:MAG: cation transporter [Spirochaetales bacterium]|nr:cation transporter [Spirochaetales bacterium]
MRESMMDRSERKHKTPRSIVRRLLPHSADEMKHWESFGVMHEVMDKLEGYFTALILELAEKPLSFDELYESAERLHERLGAHHREKFSRGKLASDLEAAVGYGVIEKKCEAYNLTPGGAEIAEHLQRMIPLFMGKFFSSRTVCITSIVVHILLSFVKLIFAAVSGSAGLVADGIDNSVDTVSSVLVWLGVKFNREKAASIFIVIMMFVSAGCVALAGYNKIINPEPITEGITAAVVSFLCGVMMLVLSIYQYAIGKRNSSFAIMCQAVDSRNHFFVSLLVCAGIILGRFEQGSPALWLYYADAAASLVICLLILKSVIELVIELAKSPGEEKRVSHFWSTTQERMKRSLIFEWLSKELDAGALDEKALEARFSKHFCEDTPKIMALSGLGYRPENSEDLHGYLELFVKRGIVRLDGGKYALAKPVTHKPGTVVT